MPITAVNTISDTTRGLVSARNWRRRSGRSAMAVIGLSKGTGRTGVGILPSSLSRSATPSGAAADRWRGPGYRDRHRSARPGCRADRAAAMPSTALDTERQLLERRLIDPRDRRVPDVRPTSSAASAGAVSGCSSTRTTRSCSRPWIVRAWRVSVERARAASAQLARLAISRTHLPRRSVSEKAFPSASVPATIGSRRGLEKLAIVDAFGRGKPVISGVRGDDRRKADRNDQQQRAAATPASGMRRHRPCPPAS